MIMCVGKKTIVALVLLLLVIKASGDGKVVSIKPVGASMEFTIRTVVGDRYQMQYRPSLLEGAWVNVGEAFVATGPTTMKWIAAAETACVLRVIKVEEPIGPDTPPGPPPPPPPPPSAR